MIRSFWNFIVAVTLTGLVAGGAHATPRTDTPEILVLNFTADWCPNCQIMDPRMDAVLPEFGARIARVDLDFTATKTGTEMEAAQAFAGAVKRLEDAKAAYLWDYYAGVTGVAVLVAADSGEPLSCITRAVSEATMRDQIAFDLVRVSQLKPGQRYREGDVPPHCPRRAAAPRGMPCMTVC